MTALLLEISIFCVRAGCEIRMESYASKHALQFLSDKPFCIYSVLRHITWKLQVISECSAYRTTAILSKTFFVWFIIAIEIWLKSYGPRHESVILWYDIVCMHCKRIYTSLFGTQLRLTTLWLHITHQTTALLPTMHHFIRAKLSSYTTSCSVFSLNCLHYY